MNEYVGNKFILVMVAVFIICLLVICLLKKKGVLKSVSLPSKSLGFLNLMGSEPIFEYGGTKYSAAAIMLSTDTEGGSTNKLDSEINYERLCRFSEAMSSFAVPSAYTFFSIPEKSITGKPLNRSTKRAFIVMWASGNDERDLAEKSDAYLRQIEGICSLVFPNAQTKRMGRKALSLILTSPLPYAIPRLAPTADDLFHTPSEIMPIPPPPQSPDPSSTLVLPETEVFGGDGPFLGWIFSNGKKIAPLALSLSDMQRHTSIFGATGSGKSTSAISIALRLYTIGISVLILDWHGEHTDSILDAGGKVFCPGSKDRGITINPLGGCNQKDIDFQVEFVTDVFSQIFQFTPPQSYMFRETLKACYRSKLCPMLSDLLNELALIPIKSSWDHETRMALMRRLKQFTEGTCGMAIDGADSHYREEIFDGLVSIDLSHLKDVNSRAIFANFIMKVVYDYSLERGEQRTLTHVLFLEESQNILPPRRPEAPRSIGERILGELRKFGEGVVVVSQFPSAISQDVIKNTAVRIIHAIRSGEDLKTICEATSMNGKQVNTLPSLAVGEAIVNLPHRASNIFVKVVPDPVLRLEKVNGANSQAYLPSEA